MRHTEGTPSEHRASATRKSAGGHGRQVWQTRGHPYSMGLLLQGGRAGGDPGHVHIGALVGVIPKVLRCVMLCHVVWHWVVLCDYT
jgi:hypothetical protein